MNTYNYLNNSTSNLLILMQLIPACAVVLLTSTSYSQSRIRTIAWNASLVTLILSMLLYIMFDPSINDLQFSYELNTSESLMTLLNLNFAFGIDGLNLWLVLLTTFLTPICVLVSWYSASKEPQKKNSYLTNYFILFLIIEVLLLLAFTAWDMLVFYVFFEAVLIPMFILVGVYGSQPWNIWATFKMFFYTLAGSLPMLAGIILMLYEVGTTDHEVLSNSCFNPNRQIVIFILWFIGLSVKTPLVPFHGWLPETHANAPTSGSIILAGLLLKLGTYGILRWCISVIPEACMYFSPIINIICLVGLIYVGLITLRQIDLKKVIAYSSIAHMAVCVLGMFSFNQAGCEGSYLMMIGHGIISPGLFICCGCLYDRYHTRAIYYYSGLNQTMPLFGTAFLVLTLANISLPMISPTFPAEFLIFTGVFSNAWLVAMISALTMVLTAAYSLFLYNRVCFGNHKLYYLFKHSDLTWWECALLLPFLMLCVLLGCVPNIVLQSIHSNILLILIR